MTHVLITGADGFIGRALTRRRVAPGVTLHGRIVQHLTMCDLQLSEAPWAPHITHVAGSLADSEVVQRATADQPDIVFNLASVPSGQSEADYEQGLSVNVHGLIGLLDTLRRQGLRPTVVFTSSIAVFGAPLPDHINDDTPLRPTLSYGAHKQMAEIFIADLTRRGALSGRSVRLPGIVARPPSPTGALSAFSSELIRALAAGQPYTCPVSADATLWLLSLQGCVDNLLHAAAPQLALPPGLTAWTLPAQRLRVGQLVQAFEQRRPGCSRQLTFAPNATLEAQFGRLPPLDTTAAHAAGFCHDGDVGTLVERAVQAIAT